jgi:tetratricopeptide (TPR) repeat protein
MIGQILGHYRIESQIGAGGMGVVYRAYDLELQRWVAIKILSAPADEVSRARLLHEARAASRLNHPNICTVHEVDQAGGQTFIVMEHVEGLQLSESIGPAGLPIDAAVEMGRQLAGALAHAHARGIVHRDLKSNNVMVTADGRAKVLDFGVAQRYSDDELQTRTRSQAAVDIGPMAGTLAYMAPERLRGAAADARSDIWALGVILYEMVTGRRPFDGRTPFELTANIIEASLDVAPPVPAPFWRVIRRCLSKEPRERYATADELRVDLDVLQGIDTRQRFRWRVAAAAAAAMVAVLVWAIREQLPGAGPGPTSSEAAVPAPAVRKAVAVFGFKNLSGRSDAAWLSTAFSEMFATELAAGEQLRSIAAENVVRARIDLSLGDVESFGKETLERIHRNLGCQFVVIGSFVLLGPGSGGGLRLDVRLQDVLAGETILALNESGTEADLLDLVSRAGARLRDRLNVGPLPVGELGGSRAGLPSNAAAARLYSEGLGRLRSFDAAGARALLERAVALDRGSALVHSALAAVWTALGYDARASEEARLAFELSTPLAREDRLSVEGRYRESARDWTSAIKTYQALWTFFPDSIDYGLRLAASQTAAGQAKEALATVGALRALPAPMRTDPRIDLAEAAAARAQADAKRERVASVRAAENAKAQGARLLLAEARLSEGSALRTLGELDNAVAVWEEAGRIFREAGNRFGAARAVNNIAIVLLQRSDLAAARKRLEEARATFREIGYQTGIAATASNLGIVLTNAGDIRGARTMFEEARAAYREIGDKRGQTRVLNNLANPLYREGNLAASKQALEEALALGRELSDTQAIGYGLIGLGDVLLEEGSFAEARGHYDQALSIMRAAGNKQMEAVARLSLAGVSFEEGRLKEAADLALDSASMFQALKDPQEAIAYALVARTELGTGDVEAAQRTAARALGMILAAGNPVVRLAVALSAGRVDIAAGRYSEARTRLEALAADAEKLTHARYRLEILLTLGELQITAGDTAGGRARLTRLANEAGTMGFALIQRKAAARARQNR